MRSEVAHMFPSMSPLFLVSLASLFFLLYILRATVIRRKDGRQLPPGPAAWPIIGNLHMLGNQPHQSLQRLAKKYGPIMCLWFGPVPTIIVSSPEAAEQFLKTHDLVFASRPCGELTDYFGYGKSMGFAPYGSYWRSMRKLCMTQLLSTSKIESFAASRREEMRSLTAMLQAAAAAGEVVDLSERIGGVIENMMHRMILGCAKSEEFDLKGLMQKTLFLVGAFNLSDFVPWLAPLDLQGLKRRAKIVRKQLENGLEKIIQAHEQQKQNEQTDFVDVLISKLNTPLNPGDTNEVHIVDRSTIKSLVQDLIGGSLDTSSTTIEWAMSELISHPDVMQKLQQELRNTIGMNNNFVDESDFDKLSYLDMVIKETLRLRTVVPLLVPRETVEDVTINGYYIPKKSRVIVNFWSIGRDPRIWSENSEEFIPERFERSDLDVRGVDFRMIPFGSGRRGCPGLQLGLVATKLVVAQLVHCFDWELPDGMKPEELDMTERYGNTLRRANQLLVKPVNRILK